MWVWLRDQRSPFSPMEMLVPLKCVVVGDCDSGREEDRSVKTSLLFTYMSDGYPKEYMPTVSVEPWTHSVIERCR